MSAADVFGDQNNTAQSAKRKAPFIIPMMGGGIGVGGVGGISAQVVVWSTTHSHKEVREKRVGKDGTEGGHRRGAHQFQKSFEGNLEQRRTGAIQDS